ncbi:MAG: GAF domain-containing protein [Caldilineaceae bacterium]
MGVCGRFYFDENGRPVRGVGVNFDITECKHHEQQQAFLLKLTDALRAHVDAVAIQATVTETTLDYFGADRCYYCEVEHGNAIIRRDAARGALPSVVGVYPLENLPFFQAAMATGRPLIVEDVHVTDLMDEALQQLCLQMGIIAFINIPVIKDEKYAGNLCITQSTPRTWTKAEITLAEEIAARTWAAVERARAEKALLESQERLRLVLDAAEMGTFLYHVAEDRGEPDARMLALFGLPTDGTLNLAEALTKLIHPADRRRYAAAVAHATDPAGDGLLQRDIRVLQPDGSVRWVAVTAQVLFDGQPRCATRMYGVAVDISARKRTEEQLRASEDRQTFLLNLSDALRPLQDPLAIQESAMKVLGAFMNVNRAFYTEALPDNNTLKVGAGYASGLPSIEAQIKLTEFGPIRLPNIWLGKPLW